MRHRVDQCRTHDHSLPKPSSDSKRVGDFDGQVSIVLLDRLSHPCDVQAFVSPPGRVAGANPTHTHRINESIDQASKEEITRRTRGQLGRTMRARGRGESLRSEPRSRPQAEPQRYSRLSASKQTNKSSIIDPKNKKKRKTTTTTKGNARSVDYSIHQ